MLLVLYGGIAEMGYNSRQHLIKAGFEFVEKLNYAVAPQLTTQYGKRNFVSEEVFLENTDSLFRYEVGGIRIGFNQWQIADAVCDKKNSLLTLSTGDISFLEEIKRVYGDKVRLIYAYIDDSTLKNIISGLSNINEDEARVRFETGQAVKRGYLQYQHLFDYVVMYGGENSVFNYANLYRQYDAIIGEVIGKEEKDTRFGDVFFSFTQRDVLLWGELCVALDKKGVSYYDDLDLPPAADFAEDITAAIRSAKIVVPVITENALSSPWVLQEILLAAECAEKNGTLLMPVFDAGVDLARAGDLQYLLATRSGVVIENGDWGAAAEKLAQKVHTLLSAEANLKAYAKQVENSLCLTMYEQAKRWQEAHLELCDRAFAASGGAFIDFEVCLLSRVKLISILLEMELYEQALDWAVEALNHGDDGDTRSVLLGQLAMCCAHLGMDEEKVRRLALDRLAEFVMVDLDDEDDGPLQRMKRGVMEELLNSFHNALATVESKHGGRAEAAEDKGDEGKIAQYGELAIALFEDLIQDNAKGLSRHDLMLGYERILNYCKHVGLKGEVADQCITRIAQLSEWEDTPQTGESSAQTQALKIYLGQILPQSGEYDVFISYKSEDEALARKVYDYLTQSGKEVFFSERTLTQLGNSEYRAAIFKALEHSRHMVLVSSNPEYLKTKWVHKEWDLFDNELTDDRKVGTLILVLADDIAADKGKLPIELRTKEIVKMSEFRSRLLSYLR